VLYYKITFMKLKCIWWSW